MNFLRVHNRWPFTLQYGYIDGEESIMDQILIDYGIPAKFVSDFHKEDSEFEFSFIKVNYHYGDVLEKKVFPELDLKMEEKYGEKYIKFRQKVEDAVEKNLKNNENT